MGFIGTVTCAIFIVHVLFKIELNHDSILQKKKKLSPEIEANLSELTLDTTSSSDGMDGTFPMDDENDNASIVTLSKSVSRDAGDYASSPKSSGSSNGKKKKSTPTKPNIYKRKRLHRDIKISVVFHVTLLVLVTYLLLVFLPSSTTLCLITTMLLAAILLRAQVIEDLRRRRLDRISGIITLILFLAAFLSLGTYAHLGRLEGEVYEGPARIVGYDLDSYDNSQGGENVMRTDLEVEWGMHWGCPHNPSNLCKATVQGALCQVAAQEKNKNRKRRTRTSSEQRLLDQDEENLDDDAFDYGYNTLAESEVFEEVIDAVEDSVEEVIFGEGEDEEIVIYDETPKTEEEIQEDMVETEVAEEKIIDQYYKQDNEVVEDVEEVEYEIENEVYDIIEHAEEDTENALEDVNEVAIEEESIDQITNDTVKEEVLEEEVIELENDVEGLAIDNEELEYVAEFTTDEEVYYAVESAVEENELEAAIEVVKDEDKDLDYYKDKVEQEEKDNSELKEENEELEKEDEELKEKINQVVEYYKAKEKHEEMVEEEKNKMNHIHTNATMGNSTLTNSTKHHNKTKTVEVEDVLVYYEVTLENGTTSEYYVVVEENNQKKGSGEYVYGYGSDETTEEEIEEAAESIYSSVENALSFDDDMFEDEYWDYEWGAVWGEYACNDLFDADIENMSYDVSEAPGSEKEGEDAYPFINIYGSCNSCQAFIVDYYSEEHFNKIRRFERHSGKYFLFGMLSLMVTAALATMQRLSPSEENEVNLLMDQNGLMV